MYHIEIITRKELGMWGKIILFLLVAVSVVHGLCICGQNDVVLFLLIYDTSML